MPMTDPGAAAFITAAPAIAELIDKATGGAAILLAASAVLQRAGFPATAAETRDSARELIRALETLTTSLKP